MALGAIGRQSGWEGFELLPLADGFERADDPDEVGDRARQAVELGALAADLRIGRYNDDPHV